MATSDIFAMLAYRYSNWRWLGDLARPVMLAAALSILFRCWVSRPDLVRATLARSVPALTLVFLAILSVRWSISRQTTILSLEWLIIVTLLGIAIATIRPIAIIVDGIALFGIVSIAIGAVLSFRFQSFRYFDSWIGLFGNKNGFGAEIAFVVPFILTASRGSHARRIAGCVAMIVVIAVMSKVGSKTSNAVVSLQLILFIFFVQSGLMKRRKMSVQRIRLAAISFLAIAAIALVTNVRLHLFTVSRIDFDITFSNRTLIWPELLRVFRSHWLHGFGAEGFWSGSKGYLLRSQIRSGNASGMVTAHNGFLQESLSFGLLGLAATLSLCLRLTLRGRRAVERGPNGAGSVIALVTVAVILQNLMEAMFTNPEGIHWFIIVVVVSLSPQRDRRKASGYAGLPDRKSFFAGTSE